MVAPSWNDFTVGPLSPANANGTSEALDRDLSIERARPEQRRCAPSPGESAKAAVTRWLVEGISLLILEEPTRGVDVGARREIYLQLRQLANRGMAVLISSDVSRKLPASVIVRDARCGTGLVCRGDRHAGRFDMAATVADPAFTAA